MKVTDLTEQLVSAKAKAESWTESNFLQVISEVLEALPGSNLDWDDGAGEDWGRIFMEGEIVIVLRRTFAFCLAHKSFQVFLEPILDRSAVVTVYIQSWDARNFRIDPHMAKQLFGCDWPSDAVDPAHFSVHDLWWATI